MNIGNDGVWIDERLQGWSDQHEATRKELACAVSQVNELLYCKRQLEWLNDDQAKEIERLRLQNKLLALAVEGKQIERSIWLFAMAVLGFVLVWMWVG